MTSGGKGGVAPDYEDAVAVSTKNTHGLREAPTPAQPSQAHDNTPRKTWASRLRIRFHTIRANVPHSAESNPTPLCRRGRGAHVPTESICTG